MYLSAERLLTGRLAHLAIWRTLPAKIVLALITYALVNVTWVFFRARDFGTASRMLRSMLGINRSGAPVLTTWFVLSAAITIGAMLVIHWRMRNRALHDEVQRWPSIAVGAVWGLMLFLIAITQGGSNAFIYFQF